MYLFIFESIGTSELVLIGIVALIFLGPRKMPEMARKIGKMMSQFRSTTSEFKETWQREANFEEEAKAFDLSAVESETTARAGSISGAEPTENIEAPAIKQMDPADFEHLKTAATEAKQTDAAKPEAANDKKNWL